MIIYAVTGPFDALLHLCLDKQEAIDYAETLNTVCTVTAWNLVERTKEVVYRKLVSKKRGYTVSIQSP